MMLEEVHLNHTTVLNNTYTENVNDDVVFNNTYPNLADYYAHLTPFVTLSIFISALVLILNIAIFSTTISKATKRLTSNLLIPTTFLCSLYPLISVAAATTILLPKSWLICHTVMHLSFTAGAVVFHNLCFRYVTSEATYMKEVDGDHEALDIHTPPCCCCCVFLPKMTPTKTKLFIIKLLIWQMPVVQSCIMIILNVIYYRDAEMYNNVLVYFMPCIITSIVFGLWGLNITVRMINKLVPDYNLMKKMLCLQLILLLCKLQYLILDKQLDSIDFYGTYPINNTIYKQTIINLLIILEMILVSTLAQNAYSKPIEL